jgi:hypothetical protein
MGIPSWARFLKENKVKFNLSWFKVIDFDLVNFLPIFILLFVLHMSSYIALNINKHRLNGKPKPIVRTHKIAFPNCHFGLMLYIACCTK